jgi:sulfotransferase
VGYAPDALREAFFGEEAQRLILIGYQALMRAPQETLGLLHGFPGAPQSPHDFENLTYQPENFDSALGTPGLHTARRRAAWVERQSVLPSGLFERVLDDMFWWEPLANIRDVPIIRYAGRSVVT